MYAIWVEENGTQLIIYILLATFLLIDYKSGAKTNL